MKDDKNLLGKLEHIDQLEIKKYTAVPSYIHKDHRFCLLLADYHQKRDDIPKPIDMILFDAHHDSLDPNIDLIKEFIEDTENDDLTSFIKDSLKQNDDDWVKAGMDLGIINNVVIFGARNNNDQAGNGEYTDIRGNSHLIFLHESLPGECLGHQGALSDMACEQAHKELWEVLGWENSQGKFSFKKDKKFWINIDLDCFTIFWNGYSIPWNEEVFEGELFKPSDSAYAPGWTGKKFIDELMDQAAIVTIATEPDFCGGEDKALTNLRNVEKHFFNITHE